MAGPKCFQSVLILHNQSALSCDESVKGVLQAALRVKKQDETASLAAARKISFKEGEVKTNLKTLHV